jgi:hypothetical protein
MGPLTPEEVAVLLRSSATAIETELEAMPRELAGWRPAQGEWCALEVVGHLIEAERRGFAGRIQLLLEDDEPRLETWDPPAVTAARRDCEKEPAQLLDEFMELRQSSLELVSGLRPEHLTRAGQHVEVGRLEVGDLLHEWIHHDRNHLRQLLANVQARVWPEMGNARRF